jgi:tetratricopeptide (TPR) repeat protein
MAAHPPGETISFRETASPLPAKLSRVVAARFPGEPRAAYLAGAFLALNHYDRRFAMELVALGRERGGASWNLRVLAAMMLANQCLRLTADAGELTSVLVSLGLLAPGASAVNADVLRQGYTSTELPAFSAQFLRHLRRLGRIHRRLRGFRTAAKAFDDFILVSRDPCRVPLARFLFAPAEVVEHIVRQLQVSSGMPSPLEDPGEGEALRYRSHLPAYENEIVRLLTEKADVYWSCERTSSEINRLIEKPIGTVASVVKLPGSALEFEIKRTGIGGPFPLGATYFGVNGNPVPPSHRLQGGASTASLRWESNHSAILSEVYRAAHHREAPVSKLLTLASYRTVPCQGRNVHLLDYFTAPEIFGPGFQKMRQQMKHCVSAYDQQYGDYDFAHLPGEAGLTGRFLYHVLPCQGLLAQTSSYRLDTLARYFSPAGAEIYFQHGLKRESHTIEEARRFADALLEEVLGVYAAPDATYVDHAQYLAAAFAVPENRRQADAMHAQAVSDLGQLWGTILALGGFSYGESFVGRNMGLKSSFAGGEWTSRLLSMDHDNLHIPDDEEEVFWAQGALRTAVQDECYIRGNPGRPKQVPQCALHYLQQIYHLEFDDTPAQSRRCLECAMGTAYRQTRRALEEDPRMRRLFSTSYLRHLRDWHVVVADYLTTVHEGDAAEFKAWKDRTEAYLTERNYDKIAENYCRALEKHSDFVRRYSFLYLPPPPQ